MKKKLKWLLILLAVVALTVWVGTRWNAWFHNPEEPPYTASPKPHRVLLTYGNKDGLSRNVSWQCDSVVRPSWIELICLNDSGTVLPDSLTGTPSTIPAEGEVFVSRSGKAAYYVARLRQLQPGRQYAYRAVTDGKCSPYYTFRVLPPERNRLSFLYVGDVQDSVGGQANRYLREAVRRHPQTELLVCGGDFTERPTDRYWAEGFRSIDSLAQHMPFLCVTGNHDYLKGVIVKLERRFPLVLSYFLDSKINDNLVYTVCDGPVQFFLLDTNREFFYLMTQRDWLQRELSASTARWKIVVLHHPLFSVRGKNNLIQRWMFNDLIEEYGVDLVLQAHEHAYARMTRHADNGQPVTPVYTVSHCSPKNYRVKPDDRFDIITNTSRYYQTVDISGDTLIMKAYDVNGHTLCDSLQILKPATGQPIFRAMAH